MGIVRQFPFSSNLQRMSILCKRIGQEQLHFFCKGSPEMVQSLCKPDTGKMSVKKCYNQIISIESIVPANHDQVLEEYTRQGFRVIAIAHRIVEIRSLHKLQKVVREDLEHDLTFLGNYFIQNSFNFLNSYFKNLNAGLVVLENRLKPDSKAIINQLSDADMRTLMVTGKGHITIIYKFRIINLCFIPGDNILTAISVARGIFKIKMT